MRHVAQPCELPHGAFEHTILVTHTSCATPATTRAKAKGGSYVTPSPPTKRSEEPRGAPYHHRYAARHRSTPTCQFWARMNSAAALARFPFQPHAFKSQNNNFCTTPKNPEITASKGLPPTCGPLRARCRPSRPTLAMAGHETCARRAWCVFRVMESRLRSEIS
jgi:hypothetical protein